MADEEIGGYRFRDASLLATALTHSSYLHEHPGEEIEDFERLEFLGDAVVDLAIADVLYQALPLEPEGRLTPRRAQLVSGAPLARVARSLRLTDRVRLGQGEQSSGGRNRIGLAAAVYESVVGAIFLDGGYVAAREFVVETMSGAIAEAIGAPSRSPKTILNERVLGMSLTRPIYELVKASGPSHGPEFVYEVRAAGLTARGTGLSKQEAEESAAASLLELLGD
jgi:ribonuclease III